MIMAAKLLMRRLSGEGATAGEDKGSSNAAGSDAVTSPPAAQGSSAGAVAGPSPMDGVLREEKGGLWKSARGGMEEDCSSTLRKIFRYTLAQALGLPATYHIGEGAVGEVLESKAKARVPEAILTLLSRLVDAEHAAALPRTRGADGQEAGGDGVGYYSAAAAAAIAATATAAAAAASAHKGGGPHGKKRKSHGRRVSFSTWDFSAVATPDPQRFGSDRPMEGVLSSLFLALKAAEMLRAECGTAGALDVSPPVPSAAAAAGGSSSSLPVLLTAAAAGTEGRVGKENDRQQVFGTWNNANQGPGGDLMKPSAATAALATASKQSLEKLVAALSELATTAAAAAASEDGRATFVRSMAHHGNGAGAMLGLLGETLLPWSEVAAAAGFYAKELRVLCLDAHEGLPFSRLMGRYHETLSSLVRYELKKVLNLCYCACELPAEEEGRSPLGHTQPPPPPQPGTAEEAPAAGGGGGGGSVAIPASSVFGVHGSVGMGACSNTENCCSAMQILVETAANLQYNSDDPAALFHFALRKVHTKRALWRQFQAQALAAAAANGDTTEDGSSTAPAGFAPEGEEDSNFMQLSSQPAAEGKALPPLSSTPAAAGAGGEYHGEEDSDEDEEDGVGPQRRRQSSSVGAAAPMPNAPAWWGVAESKGGELLSYLGAVSFLSRVLQDPMVAQAVSTGRWGRVERLAGMVSGVMGVVSEDDSLRPLADLLLLQDQLEEELAAAQEARQALADSTPADVLASIPVSQYAAQAPRRKRKRSSRFVKGHIKDVLIWVRSNELPEQATYPHLVPLCVYATGPSLLDGDEDDEEDDEEEEEGQEEGMVQQA